MVNVDESNRVGSRWEVIGIFFWMVFEVVDFILVVV